VDYIDIVTAVNTDSDVFWDLCPCSCVCCFVFVENSPTCSYKICQKFVTRRNATKYCRKPYHTAVLTTKT